MITLKTYNGKNTGAFYIQSKGDNAGRPLKTPIPNCFVVETTKDLAYQIVYSMFTAGKFRNLILGSVVPFIRLREAQTLLNNYFDLNYDSNKLKALEVMDESIRLAEEKILKLKQLKKLVAMKSLQNENK